MIPRNCCNFLVFLLWNWWAVSAWLSFGYNIATFLPMQDNCIQDKSDNGMQFTVMKTCNTVMKCKERNTNYFESVTIFPYT